MTGRGQSGEDPWSDWVLGNYSLYTTILVAFARQASKMSFKVGEGVVSKELVWSGMFFGGVFRVVLAGYLYKLYIYCVCCVSSL